MTGKTLDFVTKKAVERAFRWSLYASMYLMFTTTSKVGALILALLVEESLQCKALETCIHGIRWRRLQKPGSQHFSEVVTLVGTAVCVRRSIA